MTDIEVLNTLGGKLGSKLVGDDGFGPEVIEITAVGEENILARRVKDRDGNSIRGPEISWGLTYRNWQLLEEVCDSGLIDPTTSTTT